jgi:hypothetical protein
MNGIKIRAVETDNTIEAAWFKTQGFRPVRVAGEGPRRRFVFEGVPEALIQAFDLDTARCSPSQFAAAYRSLLRMLHQETPQ